MKNKSQKGFTLVEILIAVSIVVLLSMIVMSSVSGSREKGRDTKRVSDLEQIRVALRLYAETNDEFPGASQSGVIGTGGSIDALLKPFLTNMPSDPLSGTDDFDYYYNGNQECGGSSNQAVVYVKTMESEQYKNSTSTKCTSWGDGTSYTNAYIVVLGKSSD